MKRNGIRWTVWLCGLFTVCSSVRFSGRTDICEPIKIPMCKNMPYNMTRMPNLLHHSSQKNSRLVIEQFQQLLDQNCSDVLLFFLCAMFAPICTVNFQSDPIPPCRSVCEKARAGCEQIVNGHNISWPDFLECSHLPTYDRGVCVLPEAIVPSIKNNSSKREKTVGGQNIDGIARPTDNDRFSPSSRKQVCRCNKRRTRPKRKKYKQGKYDFAIRGQIEQQGLINSVNTVSRITVIKVFKSNKVKISENTTVDLWTNSACVCPKLVKRKEYLLIGYDDPEKQRLLFLDNCLATRWQNKWEKRIKKWERVKKPRKNRKRCKKKKGGRCKSKRKFSKSKKGNRIRKSRKNKNKKRDRNNSTNTAGST